MEFSNDPSVDDATDQYQRLILMAEICSRASAIGREALERGKQLDVKHAYEQALLQTLEQNGHDKNELVGVWAMLILGAQAIKKVCTETNNYALGEHREASTDNPPSP